MLRIDIKPTAYEKISALSSKAYVAKYNTGYNNYKLFNVYGVIRDAYIQAKSQYIDIVLGKRKKFSNDAFPASLKREHSKIALQLLHYVYCESEGFTPKEVCERLTPADIRRRSLNAIVKKISTPTYVRTNASLSGNLAENLDINYILHLLFPRYVKYNIVELVTATYNAVQRGLTSFPKSYFDDELELDKRRICLSIFLRDNKLYNSPYDFTPAFKLFGDNIPRLNKMLREAHLFNVAYQKYEYAIDWLWDTLTLGETLVQAVSRYKDIYELKRRAVVAYTKNYHKK